MSSKPKILFVYDIPPEHVWRDGLWAALQLLEKDFDVHKENLHETVAKDPRFPLDSVGYDFCLGWGGFGSLVDQQMQKYKDDCPRGLCIGGNANQPIGADKYNVLFCETRWYRSKIAHLNDNIHLAFGVNTDIFKPFSARLGLFDYLGVGAFATWKRWEKMIDKDGSRLVIGYYQDNNESESLGIVQNLVKNGVMVSNQVSPQALSTFYNLANKVYIPADINGGGERTLLEARACGCEVEIEPDNPKLQELLEGPVLDHHHYYKQLLKGIKTCL